jgi:PqqA peptide cyclase
MRKSWAGALVDRAVRGGRPVLLATAAWRAVALVASRRLGRPLAGPVLGVLAVTRSCPHRCDFCEVPRGRGGEGQVPELDAAGKARVLEGLAAIGCLAVTFTGGEPLLDAGLEDLVARAAALGLEPHLSTTGWGLDADRAARLVAAGLAGATVTVAAHRGAKAPHFDEGVAAVRFLAAAGRSAGRRLSLATTTVLSRGRLPEASAVLQRLLDEGLDRVGVMPELDLSAGPGRPPRADPAMGALARDLVAWRRATGRIDNSRAYLEALPRWDRPDPLPVPCVAPFASLVVDASGSVHACVPAWLKGQAVGSVRESPLEVLWRSGAWAAERRRLADCRECLWNCHAEMSLAVARPWETLR